MLRTITNPDETHLNVNFARQTEMLHPAATNRCDKILMTINIVASFVLPRVSKSFSKTSKKFLLHLNYNITIF